MDIYLILNIPVDTWLCSSESHDIDKFLASNWHNLSASQPAPHLDWWFWLITENSRDTC